jgi:signal peptidase I
MSKTKAASKGTPGGSGAKKRAAGGGLLESAKTIAYALLIAVGVRTFVVEPFNIPSGSMLPTLQIGDYLFVSKFAYGYSYASLPFAPHLFSGRIPAWSPARGDVAVFKWPGDNSTDYIKRVIGLPGDRVQVREGQVYINGTLVPRKPEGDYADASEGARGQDVLARRYQETLPSSTGTQGGVTHEILKKQNDTPVNNTPEVRVPPGFLFVMGDNRDNSADSRVPVFEDQQRPFLGSGGVGLLPMENLVGKAEFIFFSFDARDPWWQVWDWPFEVRWSRLLHGIT